MMKTNESKNQYNLILKLNVEEAKTIIVSALDYSFGRMTYLPSYVVGIIKDHWDELDDITKNLILTRVVEKIDYYERVEKIYQSKGEEIKENILGMKMDVEMWYEFKDWLLENNPESNEMRTLWDRENVKSDKTR